MRSESLFEIVKPLLPFSIAAFLAARLSQLSTEFEISRFDAVPNSLLKIPELIELVEPTSFRATKHLEWLN
jgi:hypothetical protein